MLSVGRMGGNGAYYLKLAREDYYLNGGEPLGRWWGKGAEEITGLRTVRNDDLRALLQGFSPDGKPLVQNAGEHHRPGWDLTFSAPKSVSVFWSQADEATRSEIQAAHYEAVKAALGYLQEEHGYTRRGKGGHVLERAGLIVATFEHGTSRALDPQLHTHALVLNVCVREDGSTGTIVSKPFYDAKMAAGALYRAELASQLKERFGIRTQRDYDDDTFFVHGVSQKFCDEMSKRRAEIVAELRSYGTESAAASAAAALATRRTKEDVPPRSELFSQWRKIGEDFDFKLSDVLNQEVRSHDAREEFKNSFQAALNEIEESESHFTELQLLQRLAVNAQHGNLSADDIRSRMKDELSRGHGEIIPLGVHDGVERYTTTTLFNYERELLEVAESLDSLKCHGAKEQVIEKLLKQHGAQLQDEQCQVVRYLTEKGGGFRSVEGLPGTGKTSTLSVAREILEDAGYQVIGTTLSAKAARELADTGGIESQTIASLKIKMTTNAAETDTKSLGNVLKHEAKQIGRALIGKDSIPSRLTREEVENRNTLAGVLKHEAKQLGRALMGKERSFPPLTGEDIQSRKTFGGALKHEANQFGRALMGKARVRDPLKPRAMKDRHALRDLLAHEANQFVRALFGKDRDDRPLKAGDGYFSFRHRPQAQSIFDKKTVLVIDEAAMVGTKDFATLMTAVEKGGGMVISVFDRKQLQAIGPGGAAAFLADRHGKTDLTGIVRQHEKWMRDAVRDLAKGDAAGALKQFENTGRLHVSENREKAISKLVSDWTVNEKGKREGSLIFVGTRAEAEKVNALCQTARLHAGELDGRSVTVKQEQFYRGDRVLFTQNDKKLNVDNGSLGTIISTHPSRSLITVKLDRGPTVQVPLKSYHSLQHGYALTTHKGQGTTVSSSYLLAGGRMQDSHLSLVQASRARESTHIYTDKHEAGDKLSRLAQQMSKEREKTLAHELLNRASTSEQQRQTIGIRHEMRL